MFLRGKTPEARVEKYLTDERARRFALLLFALLLAAACRAGAEGQGSDHARVPDLRGTWVVEIRRDDTGPSAAVIGAVSLRPSVADSACSRRYPDMDCESHVQGSHDLDLAALLGYALPAEVDAVFDDRGSFYMKLGGCCDRGELDGVGRVDEDGIVGSWTEARAGEGTRRGTFRLRRNRPEVGQ